MCENTLETELTYPTYGVQRDKRQSQILTVKENKQEDIMLTVAISLVALFAFTAICVHGQQAEKSISIKELWKIRAYQEDDAKTYS